MAKTRAHSPPKKGGRKTSSDYGTAPPKKRGRSPPTNDGTAAPKRKPRWGSPLSVKTPSPPASPKTRTGRVDKPKATSPKSKKKSRSPSPKNAVPRKMTFGELPPVQLDPEKVAARKNQPPKETKRVPRGRANAPPAPPAPAVKEASTKKGKEKAPTKVPAKKSAGKQSASTTKAPAKTKAPALPKARVPKNLMKHRQVLHTLVRNMEKDKEDLFDVPLNSLKAVEGMLRDLAPEEPEREASPELVVKPVVKHDRTTRATVARDKKPSPKKSQKKRAIPDISG